MNEAKNKYPKYSIIIPSYNGIRYLPSCIETIISQNYSDYELIISDDHSTDGTKDYFASLRHPNVKIIEPPNKMSMAEHWEWALAHAKGEWLIFVGQDDGLQTYFFELADILTALADKKRLRTIASRRAYYFWPGCEELYGKVAVNYSAGKRVRILNSKWQALLALLGFQDYFELPQMYTTSLFHKSLIEEAKAKQDGRLFVTHPQDANLAAISCSLEDKYLRSEIPLGWIGTSPKSAGMAIGLKNNKPSCDKQVSGIELLRTEYIGKVKESSLKYHPMMGDFSFGSIEMYFLGAIMQTSMLRPAHMNDRVMSKSFRIMVFSAVMAKIFLRRGFVIELPVFRRTLELNAVSILFVSILFPAFLIAHILCKIIKKALILFYWESVSYITQQKNIAPSLIDVSESVKDKIMRRQYFIAVDRNSKKI